jgi:hypothetical protein
MQEPTAAERAVEILARTIGESERPGEIAAALVTEAQLALHEHQDGLAHLLHDAIRRVLTTASDAERRRHVLPINLRVVPLRADAGKEG